MANELDNIIIGEQATDETPISTGNITIVDDQITIEGVIARLDENGNAINESGEIIKTKEEIETALAKESAIKDEEELTPIQYLEKSTNILITNEDGTKVEFDDTPQGLVAREIAVWNTAKQVASNEALYNFFKQHPDLEELYSHKLEYGSLETFRRSKSFGSIELTNDLLEDSDLTKEMITEYRRLKGDTPEEIQRFITNSEKDSLLKEDAVIANKYIKTHYSNIEQEKVNKQNQFQIDEAKKVEEYYDEIKNVIDRGNVLGLAIPELGIKIPQVNGTVKVMTKYDIFKYIAEDTGNGYSQAQIDEYNRNQDKNNVVYKAIWNLTNGDMSQLVKQQLGNEKIKSVKGLFADQKELLRKSNPTPQIHSKEQKTSNINTNN